MEELSLPDLLITKEVAQMCRVSEATARWWRHVRTGPPSFKVNGAVRYRRVDVEAWLTEQYERTATTPTNIAKGIA